MKTLLMVTLVSLSLTAGAAVQKKKPVAQKAKASASASTQTASTDGAQTQAIGPKKKLSKDISFTGAAVDGKYLSAGDSIAEVEGDKEMGALIGIRKNFHDRLNDETARLQTARAAGGKGN